ncbi:MAG: thiamine phosphate synthase [Clostridiales Family XIII bacterium]|jgi:thiamine-phosphate pyrophosphorylase|nr:thiamine phosphate synthase [Clostridiales Family XIII bacterium]
MFEIVAVTNRLLCAGDFTERLDAVAAAGVSAVILREKDLSAVDYEALFLRALAVCARRGTPLIAHGFAEVARRAGCGLHLPFAALEAAEADAAPATGAEDRAARNATVGALPRGVRTGVSVHAAEEARRAAQCGAAYVVAGHIFPTESKAGRAPRGLRFLSEICAALSVPVYAIGGVSEQNIAEIKRAGAAGACLMSSFMTCADPAAYAEALRRALAGY